MTGRATVRKSTLGASSRPRATQKIELMRDEHELTAIHLRVPLRDPIGKVRAVHVGVLDELGVDGVDQVVEKVRFVGGVAARRGPHEPIRSARGEHLRARTP